MVIGDDSIGLFIESFPFPDTEFSVQERSPARGNWRASIHRGLRRETMTFVVHREHEGLKEAFEFKRDHADDIPKTGTLLVQYDPGESGESEMVRHFCLSRISDAGSVGRSTKISYTFLCDRPT